LFSIIEHTVGENPNVGLISERNYQSSLDPSLTALSPTFRKD